MKKETIDLSREQKLAQGLSANQELKERQIMYANGDTDALETVEASRKKGRRILAIEAEEFVHIDTVTRHLNGDQKSFSEEKITLKVSARDFEQKIKEGMFKTFDEYEVIHDPRKDAPKSYNLKGEEPTTAGAVPPVNIAAREKRLAEKEAALDEKIKQMDDIIAKYQTPPAPPVTAPLDTKKLDELASGSTIEKEVKEVKPKTSTTK
jgi:hypothetical protein